MDDRPDVGSLSVDLGMERHLLVDGTVAGDATTLEIEQDEIIDLDLGKPETGPLDPEPVAARAVAHARVTEMEVLVTLPAKDVAGVDEDLSVVRHPGVSPRASSSEPRR
jgi:hypothetical protein